MVDTKKSRPEGDRTDSQKKEQVEYENVNIFDRQSQEENIINGILGSHKNVKIVSDGILCDCLACGDTGQHLKIFTKNRTANCFKCGNKLLSEYCLSVGLPDYTLIQSQKSAPNLIEIWNKATSASQNHPYLIRKKVQAYVLKQIGDILLVPYYKNKILTGIQRIKVNGEKLFFTGSKVSGAYSTIGTITDKALIAEGFATAASIHEATGLPCVIAGSCGNLKNIIPELQASYPGCQFVIAGDVEESGAGIHHANEAGKLSGWPVILPGSLSAGKLDFNDLRNKCGDGAVRAIIEEGFYSYKIPSSAPIIPNQSLDIAGVRGFLRTNKYGDPKKTDENIFFICDKDKNIFQLAKLNTLSANIEPSVFDTLPELEIFLLKHFSTNYRLEIGDAKVKRCIQRIAQNNKYNPIYDFFMAKSRPNKNQLSTFLSFCKFNAPENLVFEIFDKFLTECFYNIINATNRHDYCNDRMLILEGRQGIGKGRMCRFLSGDSSFYHDLSAAGNLTDKDTLTQIAAKITVELSELEGLRNTRAEAIKAFISKTEDLYRQPYAPANIKVPRICSFIGTTNSATYLNDPTGARRFYPLEILEIDSTVFEMEDLRSELLAYYFYYAIDNAGNQKAINAVKKNSPELDEYLQKIRTSKFQESVYDSEIDSYINAIEAQSWNLFPERLTIGDTEQYISASEAGKFIFSTIDRIPQDFIKAFAIAAVSRAYVNAGQRKIKGRRIRAWIKQ